MNYKNVSRDTNIVVQNSNIEGREYMDFEKVIKFWVLSLKIKYFHTLILIIGCGFFSH